LQDERLGFFLLAQTASDTVGVAAISFAWTLEYGGKTAWLDELYVVPERRSEEIGRALLKASIATAGELGCLAMDLEVDQGRQRAERLYACEGFQRLPRNRWARRLV
jgi:GNAT superfamily N-acetyltransferase